MPVQRGTFTGPLSELWVGDFPISPVNIDKAILLPPSLSVTNPAHIQWASLMIRLAQSGDDVKISTFLGGTGSLSDSDVTWSWEVWDDPRLTVVRGLGYIVSGQTETSITIPGLSYDSSFVVPGGCIGSPTMTNPSQFRVDMFLDPTYAPDTRLIIKRHRSSTGDYDCQFTWQVAQFEGATVRHFPEIAFSTSQTISLNPKVVGDLRNKSFIVLGGYRTTRVSNPAIYIYPRVYFNASGDVVIQKNAATGTTTASFSIVEHPEIFVQQIEHIGSSVGSSTELLSEQVERGRTFVVGSFSHSSTNSGVVTYSKASVVRRELISDTELAFEQLVTTATHTAFVVELLTLGEDLIEYVHNALSIKTEWAKQHNLVRKLKEMTHPREVVLLMRKWIKLLKQRSNSKLRLVVSKELLRLKYFLLKTHNSVGFMRKRLKIEKAFMQIYSRVNQAKGLSLAIKDTLSIFTSVADIILGKVMTVFSYTQSTLRVIRLRRLRRPVKEASILKHSHVKAGRFTRLIHEDSYIHQRNAVWRVIVKVACMSLRMKDTFFEGIGKLQIVVETLITTNPVFNFLRQWKIRLRGSLSRTGNLNGQLASSEQLEGEVRD
jgi:hypothetical protein